MPQLITPGNLRPGASRAPTPLQVIDVGREPTLKAALLSGRLTNLAAPFLYHDPANQLALILMPMEMGLSDLEQQRIIGQLTQTVMRNLPPDAPRAYLLQPRIFFSFQSLVEAILEKDGITPEMLRAQQEKADLIRDLARSPDEATLRARVRENDDKVDAALFDILAASVEASLATGRETSAQALLALQKILLEETTYGRRINARLQALEALQKSPSREVLLEQLIAAPDAETREVLVTTGRRLLDYAFFQMLSTRIDNAADPAERDRLIALRKEVQDIRDKVDAASRAFLEGKARLIEEIALSKDPLQTAREHAAEIDDTFLAVLQMNEQAAQRNGDEQTLRALAFVREVALQVLAEQQPPEIQIINMLLSARYPDETEKLLNEIKSSVDDRLITIMAQFADQLAQQDRTDLAAKMTNIIVQARDILPKHDPSRQPPADAGDAPEPPQKPLIEIARR